jgi:dihydroorotate dehydrogenase
VYETLKRLLFALPAEPAHHLGLWSLGLLDLEPAIAKRLRAATKADHRPHLATTVAGIAFPNPVGLAAGLDKDGEAITGLMAFGFGFIEVGTVTPKPQPGNDAPRLFRVPEYEALINRMGFNNKGAGQLAGRLRELTWRPAPIGLNLGKNKTTPNEEATADYLSAARILHGLGDYVVVNLSSPNTPGLRALQAPEALASLLTAVRAEVTVPLFLKLAPDLTDEALDGAVDVALGRIDGLICTNTTLARPFEHPLAAEAGGLSGKPLRARSTEVVRRAFRRASGKLAIIGVGGVFDADDAWEKICAGASLVQVYSGFVYGGPGLPKRLLDGLESQINASRLSRIADAVGRDA